MLDVPVLAEMALSVGVVAYLIGVKRLAGDIGTEGLNGDFVTANTLGVGAASKDG